MLTPASDPVTFVGEVFTAEVAGLSLLKVALAGAAIAATIGGLRWAFNKALGRQE